MQYLARLIRVVPVAYSHSDMAKGRSKKAAYQAAQPSILTLPDELLARIFGHLSFKDKVLCQLLSRKMNNFLSCPGSGFIWGTIALAELPQLYETASSPGKTPIWNDVWKVLQHHALAVERSL